jgi:CheY-like chemotaxis protein
MKPKQTNPINILLADDDADDRSFFEKALKEISVASHLTTVKDGEQLMNYLSKNSEHLPDVLFLDLNMPRKNGSECLSEIKQNPRLKGLPVIIYSTSVRKEITEVLYQNGAHYNLQKCDFPELANSIQRVLNLLAQNPHQPPRDKFVLSLAKV